MGLFKTKEEKEKIKKERELKKESSLRYMGKNLEPIGQIPQGSFVILSLIPEKSCLNIRHQKTDITLPYERIISFTVNNEVSLTKSGSTIKRAAIGGFLFGDTGAVVGGMSGKGNTTVKWFGTLLYKDKDGNNKELNFLEETLTGCYKNANKSYMARQFEETINKIASRYAENITEL